MRTLSFEAFRRAADAYDAAVHTSDLADRYCTSSYWVLPARTAFAETVEPFVCQAEQGWVPLMRMETVLGRTLLPLEASWGLAAPFVGDDRSALARVFIEHAMARRGEWDAMFLSGMERNGPDFQAIVSVLSRRFRLGLGQVTGRCVASLEGGYDGFLSRRKRTFRKNLRSAARKAEFTLRFETHRIDEVAAADEAFGHVIEVERTSWKAAEGHGIVEGPMNTFYATMVRRLALNADLRVTFAFEGEERVGYVLGGVFGDTYRGLQISYHQRNRGYSVGNLMQAATVRSLCEEGIACYDLGTDMAYKRAWAEQLVETVPLVVR